MTTLTIAKSLQNTPILITEEATELSFDFNLADALFERVEDDMVVSLDDGTSIVLEDFYAIYSSEFLPDFQFLDSEVTGEEFFAALDPNLMPAAGPAATAVATGGGRFYVDGEYGTADGIDSLGDDGIGGGSEYTRNAFGAAPREVNIAPEVTSFTTLEVAESGHDNNLNPLIFDANEEFTSPSVVTGLIEAEDGNGDTLSMSLVGNGVGAYGVFTFDATTNTYTYTLDNTAADSLGITDTVTETYTILIEDGQGASVTQEITVTIQGRNDRPELSVTANQATSENGESAIILTVTEDAGVLDTDPAITPTATAAELITVTGQASGFDVDSGAVLNFSISDGSADQNAAAPSTTTFTNAYGTFSIDNDPASANYGQFTFVLNNDSVEVQQLGHDAVQALTFTVYVYDENGAWQSQEVTVEILGNNDKPILTISNEVLTVIENGHTNNSEEVSGTLKVEDIDVNDTAEFSLTFNPLTVEDVKDALNLDALLGKIDISKLENLLGSKVVSALLENTQVENLIDLATTSIENVIDEFSALNKTGEEGETVYGLYGKMIIELDSDSGEYAYTYTLYSQEEAEALGTITEIAYWALKYRDDNEEAVSESFTVTVTDSAGATDSKDVTVKVFGSNDKPVIEIANDMEVRESGNGIEVFGKEFENATDLGNPVAVGQLVAVDDINDMLGNLTFSVDNFAEKASNNPLFDKSYDVEGYGTLYLNSKTGTYTFILNNKSDVTQALNEGEKEEITIEFKAFDGNISSDTKEITLTITGTNDRPTLEIDKPELTITDLFDNPHVNSTGVTASVSGKATATDVDQAGDLGDELTFSLSYMRPTLDNVLKVLDAEVLAKLATVLDVAKLEKLGEISEDAYGIFENLPTSGDTVYGLYGKMEINAEGVYTYTLYTQAEAEALGTVTELAFWALQMRNDNDEALSTENFTIYVSDEEGAWREEDVTVTVKGSNDTPVIHQVIADTTLQESGHGIMVGNEYVENAENFGKSAVAGQIVASDIDADDFGKLTFSAEYGDVKTQANSGTLELKDLVGDFDILLGNSANVDVFGYDTTLTNDFGTLYLNSKTGTYVFVLDNDSAATQALNEGEMKDLDFTFSVSDGSANDTAKVTIKLEGTNDKPDLKISNDILSVEENKGEVANSVSGTILKLEDVDAGETATLDVNLTITRPELGNATLQAIFDKVLDSLGVNDSVVDGVREAIEKLYKTLGENPENSPISEIEGIKYGDISEDGSTVYGLYGKMVLDLSAGTYTYTLYTWDEAKGSVDTMAAYLALQHRDGDEALPTENFTISVKDENGAWTSENITVEVQTIDDRPTITFDSNDDLSVTEAGHGGEILGSVLDSAVENLVDDLFAPVEGLPVVDGYVESIKQEITDILESAFEGMKDEYSPNFTYEGDTSAKGEMTISDDDGVTILIAEGSKPTFDTDKFTDSLLENLGDLGLSFEGLAQLGELLSTATSIAGLLDGSFTVDKLLSILDGAPELSDLAKVLTESLNLDVLLELAKNSIKQTVEGEFGTLEIYQDGEYSYTLNNEDTDTQALNKDEQATDSFTIKVYDKFGQVTEQDVEITVTGSNDKPVITSADNLSINDSSSVKGSVLASDLDKGEAGTLKYYVGDAPASQTLDEYLQANSAEIGDSVRQSIQDKIDANNKEIKEIIEGYEAEKIRLETEKQDYQSKIADLQAENAKNKEDLSKLEEELGNESSSSLFGGSVEATGLYKTLEDLKDQLGVEGEYRDGLFFKGWLGDSGLYEQLHDGKITPAQFNTQKADLDKLIAEAEKAIADKQNEIAEEEATVSQLNEANNKEIAELEAKIEDVNKELYGDLDPSNVWDKQIIDVLDTVDLGNLGLLNVALTALGITDLGAYLSESAGVYGALAAIRNGIVPGADEYELQNAAYETLLNALTGADDSIYGALKEMLDEEKLLSDVTKELNHPEGIEDGLVEIDGVKYDIQEGQYGSLKINVATGEYTYEIDYDKLPEQGQTTADLDDESFTIYVKDENGAWDSKEITVNIADINDIYNGDANPNNYDGGIGNDRIIGNGGNDELYGGDGNDYIDGKWSDDFIDGGDGKDSIFGGEGNDTLYGGAGNDIIWGGDGNDTLFGGDGNDYLKGGNGVDKLFGGAGKDELRGGKGNDTLTGGEGADTFVWKAEDFQAGDEDIITDFNLAEGDLLNLSDFADTTKYNVSISDDNGNALITIADAANAAEYQTILLQLQDTTIDEINDAFDTSTLIIK